MTDDINKVDIPRYRLRIEGGATGWGCYPQAADDGDWCRYSEVVRSRFCADLVSARLESATTPAEVDVPTIDRDEAFQRDYIPLGRSGWEIQTKGKGSTYRICDKDGDRLAIPDTPYLHETLTRMARDVHADYATLARQLAEAKAEVERLCEIEAAAVKVEEGANAFAADLERWAHDPLVGLTPMRLGDVERHASQIRAIACNLAGARHSNREQAESALAAARKEVQFLRSHRPAARRITELEAELAAATRRVAEVEGLVGKWRTRMPANAPNTERVLMREYCADQLEAALTKEPAK